MAPISPGKPAGPPRKARKPTATTKSHRYEPFTKRVAKLKIDPVHKVQVSRLKESNDDISQSYFRAALEEWSELNLTSTFTSFFNQVNPLCESLPQLLHHADRVVQSLLEHIEKQEPLALEVLLSLVAHLAHDLGQGFEKYFAQTVKLVVKVSTTQDDPAVVEACFTCLAWMYKYLSRLLVQDLKPLLDILLPYFSARKEYIRRFTAESLAFLIRKAAVLYPKNQKPLTCAIEHIVLTKVRDLNEKEADAYVESSRTLLAESAAGVDAALHSSAPELFTCLYGQVLVPDQPNALAVQIIEGMTINLIHRTDVAGFRSLLEVILETAGKEGQSIPEQSLALRLLLIAVATRGGSRISDWTNVLQLLLSKLQTLLQQPESAQTIPSFIEAVSAALQYAPLDQLLPSVSQLVIAVIDNTNSSQFFTFCEAVAILGRTRFQDLLLPHLQHYIASRWGDNEVGLVVLLDDLQRHGAINKHTGKPGHVAVSETWEASIREGWKSAGSKHSSDQAAQVQLLMARSILFPRSLEATAEYRKLLAEDVRTALSDAPSSVLNKRIHLGWGLETLVNIPHGLGGIRKEELNAMMTQEAETFQLLPFVQALGDVAAQSSASMRALSSTTHACSILVKNMLNASLDLRRASLKVLKAVHGNTSDWFRQIVELLQMVLDTDYSIGNARQLAMLVRRLPQMQKSALEDPTLSKLIPTFALGLLPDYHDQLRRDVSSAITQMVNDLEVEELVLDVIKDWLQAPVAHLKVSASSTDELPSRVSVFECTKLSAVDDAYASSADHFANPEGEVKDRIESAHALLTLRTPSDSRSLALQVLLDMPQTAEKRSKILVPAFLAAQRGRTGHDPNIYDESHSVNTLSPDIEEHSWSLKERKLFLQLIGHFNNPKMLYRADDVYTMLLELLGNGDADTRKLALLAILKWKNPALVSHQDALLQVAEDKTTTSELGLMLNTNSDSSAIRDESRAEVLPILLRLVFGQLIGRVGVHGSQEAKRKSLLRLVFRMQDTEVLKFLDVVLGRLREVFMTDANLEMQKHYLTQDLISADQQYGFLRMVLSMLEILQLQFSPFGHKILDSVLYCTTRAYHRVQAFEGPEAAPALVRNIRRTGLRCLNLIFEYCPDLELQPYQSLLWNDIVGPRMPNFTTENSQGVSGLLKMFSVWAHSRRRVQLLITQTHHVLESCWSLLASEHAKAHVKEFVIDEIIGPLLDLADSEQDDEIASSIIQAEAARILDNLAALLQQSLPKDLLLTVTRVVQRLDSHVEAVATRQKIIGLLVAILGEPHQRLPPHIKGQVLKAIKGMAESTGVLTEAPFTYRLFELVCSYFDFFRDLPNRESCSLILKQIAQEDGRVRDAADVCEDLNAYSTLNLDEINHERQAAAFSKIHKMLETPVSGRSFLPILHNLIFLMRSTDDAAIRGNALGCIKHFVKTTADDLTHAEPLSEVLLQAIRKHIKDDSETVRADFAELLGAVVQHWTTQDRLRDMQSLLVGNDEEASFFTNILHIQQHRRNRAIRRLITEVETGGISAENIADYFLPLLLKFATDTSNSESAQATKGQSVASMTILLQWLDWKTFRRVFRQYRSTLESKSEDDKIDVRLLDHAADALTEAIEKRSTAENHDDPVPHLTKSLPAEDIIVQELKTNFISKLTELSHYKDEGEVSQRIPAAVVAVKLIKLLPASETPLLATPVVLDVAQVLRSRTQETRDLARNKLAEIVVLLGSSSMQFVLKELRTALTQGYQLHVLSYTMHTILLATAHQRTIGDLDYCLDDLVKVVLDDVFGAVGQQKDNQDYISSMKEVKRNKSFDSMEILAKCTAVRHLSKLVLPFETLLTGSLSSKQARSVDELFRRLGVGISHSSVASNQDLLVFAFELIQSFYRAKPAQPVRVLTNDEKIRARFIVQKDNTSKVGRVNSSSLLYKLAKFAIDIARSTFARHSELMTPQNVHGFLPIIGDALVEAQEDVKVSALRLLSTVIKLHLPEMEQNSKLYVMEAVKVVKGAVSTNEEAAQAALKLVSTIIREQSHIDVRESDIAYLLKRTMPDLEEPDRQGVTFNLVKAVMARQMQMPEIYELVDQISLMMVTSQARSSRDAARGVYVHFLLDYPQGKARWSKQVKFLVKNLEYQYPEGRQSIIEASSTLLSKIDKGTAQELAAVMFVPILLRMANDDNLQCREMAGALLAQLFRKTPRNGLSNMLEPLRAWLEQSDNIMLKKVSLQAWSIYFKAAEDGAEEEVTAIRDQLLPVLRDGDEDKFVWEVKYHALELVRVLVDGFPHLMLTTKQKTLWQAIVAALNTHYTWLQSSASRLIGLYFCECIAAGRTAIPLSCSQGLSFEEPVVIDLLRSSIKVLKHQSTTTELAEIVTQNLLFLARCVDASEARVVIKAAADESDGDTDDADNNTESDIELPAANGAPVTSIPASQYLLDQAVRVLRREPSKYNAMTIRPKISFLTYLTTILPHISTSTISSSHPSIISLIVPLLYLTSTNTHAPRSADLTFSTTYQALVENAQLLLEAIQAKVGDRTYAKLVTAATKQAREKRQERRNKRAIETIAEPEKAAQDKRRKFEKKKDRRKEVKGMHRSSRRKDLGF